MFIMQMLIIQNLYQYVLQKEETRIHVPLDCLLLRGCFICCIGIPFITLSMGIAICPVSYSNSCNFTEVVNSGIKDQYRDTFDAFVKVWNSNGLTSCPSLVTSSSKPLYSRT